MTTVALNKLALDPSNVRTKDVAPSEEMLASIKTMGLIEPLIVRANGKPDHYLVTNGGRRYRALCILAKDGHIPADHPVEVVIREEDEKKARLTSLSTFIRDPLHEVDQFEAFAALQAQGLDNAEIGKRFAMKPKEVLQILALGNLAPEIREAWKADKLQGNDAKAFTLEPDKKKQAELFKKLKKSGNLFAHAIRRNIIGEKGADKALLALVTRKAYEAAGGKITEDLFGDDHVLSDLPLLKKMADVKLVEMTSAFLAEGWGWAGAVEPYGDLPSEAHWNWGGSNTKAKPNAKQGVVIVLSRGELEIRYGAMNPKDRRAAEKAKAAKAGDSGSDAKAKPKPQISEALNIRVGDTLTNAAAKALLAVDARLGLAALVAGFNSDRHSGPVKVSDDGLNRGKPTMVSFAKTFAEVKDLKIEKLIEQLVLIAARSFELKKFKAPALKDASVKALCDAIGSPLVEELRKSWDSSDYLSNASKPTILQAIAEAVSPAEAKKLASSKRADIAKFAIANVPKTGWLPVELRTGSYSLAKPKPVIPTAPAKPKAKAKPVKK